MRAIVWQGALPTDTSQVIGFSGTPVSDGQLSGVLGMAITADANTDRVTKAVSVTPNVASNGTTRLALNRI